MPNITFQYADGSTREVAARDGESILALAWRVEAGIDGDCEGAMACSTCHVILTESDFDRQPPPSEEEDSILDLAPGAGETSRLGCQIVLNAADEGMIIRIPTAAPSLL
ncbi:MAG: 2Fe-2S iron-sulfur cluster-binding protein [Alphaproteobacteria bacterium]